MATAAEIAPSSHYQHHRSNVPHSRLASSNKHQHSSSSKSLEFHQFGFSAHDKYRAQQDLLVTRSNTFHVTSRLPPEDIWRRKPPDFRPQTYLPKPPKRNSRDSIHPRKKEPAVQQEGNSYLSGEDKETIKLPKILQPKRPKSRTIVTKFDIPSPEDEKKAFVTEGMFKKEQYSNPKKHDFRQYPPIQKLGLPEFETYKDPDPFNINFKTKNLDVVYGLPQHGNNRYMGRQMGQPMPRQPRYESDLLLPKQKWPNAAAEFTRHRPRVRTPHTALMDTIEERLIKQWSLEKSEREQRQKEHEKQEKERRFKEQVAKGVAAASKKGNKAINEFDFPKSGIEYYNQRLPSSSTRSYISESSTLS